MSVIVSDVHVHECTAYSEREALRAVIAYHHAKRGTRDSRGIDIEDFDALFLRPPVQRSIRKALVEVAVKRDANVFATDHGDVDELRYFVDLGLPVIVAMCSQSARNIDALQGAALVTKLRSHFAVVVAVSDEGVKLMCPQQGEQTPVERVEGQTIPLDEFMKRWICADQATGSKSGIEKVSRWYAVLNFDAREFAPAFDKGRDWTPLDHRRRGPVLWTGAALLAAEVYLTYLAYADASDFVPPLIAFFLAVVVCTAIDFFARPEKRPYTRTLVPRWYRAWLPLWCLVPFIVAIGGSAWVHYEKWGEARDDVHELAAEVKAAVEWPDDTSSRDAVEMVTVASFPALVTVAVPASELSRHRFANDMATDLCWKNAYAINELWSSDAPVVDGNPNPFYGIRAVLALPLNDDERRQYFRTLATQRTWSCFTNERVHDRVAKLVATRYPDKTTPEARRFSEVVEVIGHDLIDAHGDLAFVCNDVRVDSGASLLLAIFVQALFVLWVPCLLAVTIGRAQKRVKRSYTRKEIQESMDLRDYNIMAEDQYLFLPRMCFAVLLILGTNYVFAPLGLKATYLMSIVDEHALPGHTTFTLWSTSFGQAPVIVVGFVGYLIYALITATQRFALDDFDDRLMQALLVRGLVVILLSLALSSSEINDFASRTFVFIAGVFPVRALEAIAKRVNVTIDPDFATSGPSDFCGLPGLDPVKVFALRAAGIQSTYDLAAMNIKDVAERVRIDPRLLGRAVDRAILIDALTFKLADKLADFGVTSATELVDANLSIAIPAATDGALLGAAKIAQERLAKDERVMSVRGWLGTTHDPR